MSINLSSQDIIVFLILCYSGYFLINEYTKTDTICSYPILIIISVLLLLMVLKKKEKYSPKPRKKNITFRKLKTIQFNKLKNKKQKNNTLKSLLPKNKAKWDPR